MITRDNYKEVLKTMSKKDIKRLFNTNKEYIVLELAIFNVGSVLRVTLTDNYNKYKNVSNDGNCILEVETVIKDLKEVLNIKLFEVINFEVFNGETNNLYNTGIEIEISENDSSKDIIKKLKEVGFLKQGYSFKSFTIDGNFEFSLYINYNTKKRFEPFCELRQVK